MPIRMIPSDATGKPKPNAQRNFTDPDSQILKGGDGWIQGYNCQAAVDDDHQLIVAIGVSNQASDAVYLLPMLERIAMNTGQRPGVLIADASLFSTATGPDHPEGGLPEISMPGVKSLDHFLLRGLEKVNGEWALIATTHILLKLFSATVAMT